MIRPLALSLALAVAVLAGCGGDDDDASPGAGAPLVAVGPGGPTSTVPAGLPEEFLPAVGPLDVTGNPLPALDDAAIDADPARGLPAPVLVGVDFDGQPVRIDAAADGPTMVVFLAHWCPHCNAEVPRLTQLRDEGRFPESLNIVAVATGSDPQRPNFPPGAWLEDLDWTWPAVADGVDLAAGTWLGAEAYGVDGFPFITLVDADGNVAARWSGESEPDEIIARLDQYLG